VSDSPKRSDTRSSRSAGILLYRTVGGTTDVEVLLVHPGGPFWARRDDGVWSIPKGEYAADEDPQRAARREFREELGSPAPDEKPRDLGEITQKSGKRVRAFALPGDLDPAGITSNTFELEWPPRSGRTKAFPEVDRAEWFSLARAREKLVSGQAELLDRLQAAIETDSASGSASSP
jgi:predicted NUDIX family NTP pyrophosphohydrolase